MSTEIEIMPTPHERQRQRLADEVAVAKARLAAAEADVAALRSELTLVHPEIRKAQLLTATATNLRERNDAREIVRLNMEIERDLRDKLAHLELAVLGEQRAVQNARAALDQHEARGRCHECGQRLPHT